MKFKEFVLRHMKTSNALDCMSMIFAVIAADSPHVVAFTIRRTSLI